MDIYNFLRKTNAFKIFLSDLRSNNVGHAYIICGRDNLSVKTMLELCACSVLCSSPLKPCMQCQSCKRVLSSTHLDCIKYPLKGDKIYTEDIDKLTEDISYRPSEGDKKVYLLFGGETINTQSQNKLLKTLEEPPQFAHIFIGTTSLENLLPTVKSRCKIIEIGNFTAEEIFSYLSAVYGENQQTRLASVVCGGLLGRAVKLSEDNAYLQLYNTVYGLLSSIDGYDSVLNVTALLNAFKDKNEILDIMQIYFRDCLMVKTNMPSLVLNTDSIDRIKAAVPYYFEKDLIDFIEAVNESKRKLSLNCNAAAIFDTLLNQIAAARQ